MGAWSKDSKTHVATMGDGDFRHSERSVTLSEADTLTIEHEAADGTRSVLRDGLEVQAGEIVDAAVMRRAALDAFLAEQIEDARAKDVLFSVHLKATMMKVSDPIIFGHVVRTFFKGVFDEHGDALARAGASPNNGLASIMTAHVVFSPLDARYPATLSEPVLNGVLRGRLGYRGLVVSDDLEMKAIVEHFGIEEAMVRGLLAGVDVFLICHSPERMHAAIDAVIRAVEAGTVPLSVVEAASARQRAFARRWAAPPVDRLEPGILRCEAHLAIAAQLARLQGQAPERDPTER